jgi:hypothetical protein
LQAEVTLDGFTLQRNSLLQVHDGRVRVRRRLEHRVG